MPLIVSLLLSEQVLVQCNQSAVSFRKEFILDPVNYQFGLKQILYHLFPPG